MFPKGLRGPLTEGVALLHIEVCSNIGTFLKFSRPERKGPISKVAIDKPSVGSGGQTVPVVVVRMVLATSSLVGWTCASFSVTLPTKQSSFLSTTFLSNNSHA